MKEANDQNPQMAEESPDDGLGSFGSLRPQIALPPSGIPGWMIAAIGAILAIGLFTLLESRRLARNESAINTSSQFSLAEPPPPLAIPQPITRIARVQKAGQSSESAAPTPLRPTAPSNTIVTTPPIFRSVQRPSADDVYAPPRFRTDTTVPPPGGVGSDSMVVDLTSGKGAAVNGAGEAAADDSDDVVRATIIRNRAAVVQQGAIIAAVLETPLNSDRPGLARAIVSSDVRSFDGSRVLIPRGSRLIGDFKADASPGMRRILVTWSRLIRPDGVAIRIGSPASDPLGGAGVPGSVNTHFFERFAGAVLQSALTIGVNVASQIPNNGSNIYVGVPSQATQLGQDLLPDTRRPPTVKVKAGALIAIFVAHDLDFSGTPAVR